ncbi:hypothetical protein, partial [Stenotrophomonas maltophilia]|uniref:hypothetical protein n=1 Tax=Stenotrophomonas maltophilia TaxID=40324 RepID=UPI0031451434
KNILFSLKKPVSPHQSLKSHDNAKKKSQIQKLNSYQLNIAKTTTQQAYKHLQPLRHGPTTLAPHPTATRHLTSTP